MKKRILLVFVVLSLLIVSLGCTKEETKTRVEEKGLETGNGWNYVDDSLEMPWYAYLTYDGEPLEDVENRNNKAIYSMPRGSAREEGKEEHYSFSYTVELKNQFVIPNKYSKEADFRGAFNQYWFLDQETGKVFSTDCVYDGTITESRIINGNKEYIVRESGKVTVEELSDQIIEENEEYYIREIDYLYTFNVNLTVPKDMYPPTAFINTSGTKDANTYEEGVHDFGTNEDEVFEECNFISLSVFWY